MKSNQIVGRPLSRLLWSPLSWIVSDEVKAGSPGAWYRFQVSVDSVAGTDRTVPCLLILQVLRLLWITFACYLHYQIHVPVAWRS